VWLTERTVDAWASIAISDRDPSAFIWCPTPREQHLERGPIWHQLAAGRQPWDVAVEGTNLKYFVLENKGVYHLADHGGVVGIDLAQMDGLEELAKLGPRPWVFYGIPQPDLTGRTHGGPMPDIAAERGTFAEWMRILTPTELRAACGAGARITGTRTFAPDGIGTAGRSLSDLLTELMACNYGVTASEVESQQVRLERRVQISAMWVGMHAPTAPASVNSLGTGKRSEGN
jgi:hypothetical protein